jgi:hypothetical protein
MGGRARAVGRNPRGNRGGQATAGLGDDLAVATREVLSQAASAGLTEDTSMKGDDRSPRPHGGGRETIVNEGYERAALTRQ